jgi:arsenate reductase
MTDIYGIKNCDTMKKAFKWLDAHDVAYDFHDYKKDGADKEILRRAIEIHGWDSVINKRGTTWRKLSDEQKSSMDTDSAITAALENPSMIKRPLIVTGDDIFLGFDESVYSSALL